MNDFNLIRGYLFVLILPNIYVYGVRYNLHYDVLNMCVTIYNNGSNGVYEFWNQWNNVHA